MKARAALLLALSHRPTHWADAAAAALPPHATAPASAGAEGGGEDGASEQPPSPSASSWSAALLARAAKGQDPYAASSPLSAAAVCRDGVALVALHHVDQLDKTHDDDASVAANEGRDADGPGSDNSRRGAPGAFRDLPRSTRGPLRIEAVHENGDGALQSAPPMSLLTAGWRTDGMELADAARELMAEEVRLYCLPFLASSSVEDDNVAGSVEGNGSDGAQEGTLLEERKSTDANILVQRDNEGGRRTAIGRQQPYYGRRIAEGLAYYLAKCSFSEGVRSLSCVGLLACGGARGGSLYLIDVTGTHRVRAHAIGRGSFALHRRMAFVDFEKMDCQEGLRALLRLIAAEGGLSVSPSDDILLEGAEKKLLESIDATSVSSLATKLAQSEEEDPSTLQKWNLPSNTGVEMAVLKSSDGRMRRVRLSSLFSNS